MHRRRAARLPLWFVMLAVPAFAQTGMVCQANAVPVTVANEATSVRVADVVVNCGGGLPTPDVAAVPQVDITLLFSSNETSRLLAPDYSEALLLVDEPGPANQSPCVAGGGVCTIAGTGSGVGTYDGSAGRPNVFQGRPGVLQNPGQVNSVVFPGVPLDPRGAGTRVLRFTNLKVYAGGTPQIFAAVSISGAGVAVNNPQVVVANAQPGVSASSVVEGSGGRISKFTWSFAETFPGLFKTRSAAAFVDSNTSPVPAPQSLVGVVPEGFETSFYNPAFPDTPQGNLGVAGLADDGTRVLVRLDQMPVGVTTTVPLVVNFGTMGVARLVDTDASGAGAFSPAVAGTLPNVGNTVVAVYEILRTDAHQVETLAIPFTFTYAAGAPGLSELFGMASLAPISGVAMPNLTAPQPRFLSPILIDAPLPMGALSITTMSLANGATGVRYAQTIQGAGGVAPYTFAVAQGALPPGLTLSPAGVLSGTPTQEGSFTFTVSLKDAAGAAVTREFMVTIAGPLTITTDTMLPAAQAGVPYTTQIEASGGVPPYLFGVVTPPPAGFTLTPAGVLTGAATAAGTATFIARVTDANQTLVTKTFTLTVNPAASFVLLSAAQLDFDALVEGDFPAAQSLNVVSNADGVVDYTVRTDGGSASGPTPVWLHVSPLEGNTPERIIVRVDQAGLAAGLFRARILVAATFGPTTQTIEVPVTLRVTDADPVLQALPPTLNFRTPVSQPGVQRQTLLLRNAGGGGSIAFEASVQDGSAWLHLPATASGSAGARLAARLSVEVDSTGLDPGFYRDVIRLTWTGGVREVPVVLWVAPQGAILDVETTGLVFTTRAGSGSSAAHVVRVLNRGEAGTAIQWSAEIVSGGDWLRISPASGAATANEAGLITASLTSEVAGFDAGPRYALVKITGGQATNSPQYVAAVLNVLPADADPPLEFDVSGVTLSAASGSAGPQTFSFQAATSGAGPVAFQATETEFNGDGWLSVTPEAGTLSAERDTAITVSADASQLALGVYKGEVGVSAGATFEVLRVSLIVTATAADARVAAGVRAAVCIPNTLVMTPTRFGGFSILAGWQEVLAVDLRDDCNNAVTGATVVVRFSNGDVVLTMDESGPGYYATTWTPGLVTEDLGVTFRANAAGFEETVVELASKVDPNDVASLAPGGVANNLNPQVDGKFAPGLVTQIYGTRLTREEDLGNGVPLATSLGDVDFVLVGARAAPLYYAGANQLVVEIPVETPVNSQQRIAASVRGQVLVGDQIDVAPVSPGVVAFPDGRLVAQKPDASVVTDENPAHRGDVLAMYLVGMGATDPAAVTGDVSGADALREPVVVTVGGAEVELTYSGTVPGGVGLYQINFVVPEDAEVGVALEVVVTQGGERANVATLMVAE